MRGRRERRLRQLKVDFDERRGYWKLKQDALDGTVWIIIGGKTEGKIEVGEDDEEDLGSYKMTLTKGEGTGNLSGMHQMALLREIDLEETEDPS